MGEIYTFTLLINLTVLYELCYCFRIEKIAGPFILP
jgi:hypothetical protein